jgi:hypothetical protein
MWYLLIIYWAFSLLIAFAIKLGDGSQTDLLSLMLFSFPIIILAPITVPFYAYDYLRTMLRKRPQSA